jgi:hypothetical protein
VGRPERHDADYFPFFVKRGKTLNILQSKFGLEGIGFFTNLMRFLALTPDHHYCIKDETDRMNFFAEIGIQDENRGLEMIELMVKTEKLERELWEKYRVIVSEAFLDSLKEAYKYRKNEIITIKEIKEKFFNPEVKPLNREGKPHTDDFPSEIQGHNTQSKVKKSKVKKSKYICGSDESQNDENPPPGEREPQNDSVSPVDRFIWHWQHNGDIFNPLARLKNPDEWKAFWEKSNITVEQIDIAMKNYVEAIKSGEIERFYIPANPDTFVLNGWIQKGQERYRKQGPPAGKNKPVESKKSLGGLDL